MAQARKTILILDDSPIDAGVITDALKDHYRCVVATNGERALALAAGNRKPDLILLDIVMSDMDGYQVCRRLKTHSETHDIPLFFLTAKTDIEDEKKVFALGAVDYIHKPISAPIVLARVKTHLAASAAATRFSRSLVAKRSCSAESCALRSAV